MTLLIVGIGLLVVVMTLLPPDTIPPPSFLAFYIVGLALFIELAVRHIMGG